MKKCNDNRKTVGELTEIRFQKKNSRCPPDLGFTSWITYIYMWEKNSNAESSLYWQQLEEKIPLIHENITMLYISR